jgi:hypothetical protein
VASANVARPSSLRQSRALCVLDLIECRAGPVIAVPERELSILRSSTLGLLNDAIDLGWLNEKWDANTRVVTYALTRVGSRELVAWRDRRDAG